MCVSGCACDMCIYAWVYLLEVSPELFNVVRHADALASTALRRFELGGSGIVCVCVCVIACGRACIHSYGFRFG